MGILNPASLLPCPAALKQVDESSANRAPMPDPVALPPRSEPWSRPRRRAADRVLDDLSSGDRDRVARGATYDPSQIAYLRTAARNIPSGCATPIRSGEARAKSKRVITNP